MGGLQIGDLTNNEPNGTDYGQTLVTRNWTAGTGPFRWPSIGGGTNGDLGGGYDYINPANRGSAGTDSRYTVQGGETLASA